MRLRHHSGRVVHLGYGTNVHPAEDLPGIVRQLDLYATSVRQHLDGAPIGLGLWLSAPVADALTADPAQLCRLRRELSARELEVVTLNGFPYQAFQAPVVKHAVYQPDWTSRRRLEHTLRLAELLAALLPDDAVRGSISTLPLAWRDPWDAERAGQASRLLDELAAGLSSLARRTGRWIQVGLEPEPGCVVETTGQAARRLPDVDTEWIGICLDLAHLACAWEEPVQALARLDAAALPVVKVQVSAALQVDDPLIAEPILRDYVEPRFLHQTRSATGAGVDDLDEALRTRLPGPWRVHFHVPLHAQPVGPIGTTIAPLRAALDALLAGPAVRCDHLEVETYTWSVLPNRPSTADELAAGIAAELAFARRETQARLAPVGVR
jgi:hypothetical protein